MILTLHQHKIAVYFILSSEINVQFNLIITHLIRPIKKIAVFRVSRPYLKKSADPKVFSPFQKINCVLFFDPISRRNDQKHSSSLLKRRTEKSIKIFSTVVVSVFLHCTPTANQKSDMKSSRMLGVFYFWFQSIADKVAQQGLISQKSA